MYAIVEEGGKQFRVEKGDVLYIEHRVVPPNAKTIELGRVLMIGSGSASKIGTPEVEGAKVIARFDEALRGPKLRIMKFRRRKGYKLRKGHRQEHLKVTIDSISG
jgi:large subunit ribosomal protein L21